jgi:RND family efflux transporter MFP subunit
MPLKETLQPAPTSPTSPRHPVRGPWSKRALVAAPLLLLGGAIAMNLLMRAHAETRLAQETDAAAVPTVTVLHPQAGAQGDTLSLPGYVEAYIDTPIYARTSGYLEHWYFDIGAHVKKGQLLAVIDTPEIDQQLLKAQGDLATAQANLALAEITAHRSESLLPTRSVSTQERDNDAGALAADKATVLSREGEVGRLAQLQSYEKVYAPFDGVITARNIDIGALIDADANSPSKKLFHMSSTGKVRVYVAVPEVDADVARNGAPASLTLDEFPGRTFQGVIVRDSNAIDMAARTLRVEVDLDNADGALLPGAYAFVHFKQPNSSASVTLPSNTLIFRKDGTQVAVVRDGRARLQSIAIGRDYGATFEVKTGLTPGDQVISDPSDSLVDDTPVRVADAAPEHAR